MSTLTARSELFGEAIRMALAEELRRDPNVFMIVRTLPRLDSVQVLEGLVQDSARIGSSTRHFRAGDQRACRRAAMTGMRPIVDIMFGISWA